MNDTPKDTPKHSDRSDETPNAASPADQREALNRSNQREALDRSNQREALKRSERRAAEDQPETFKDEETENKTVEIGQDMTEQPIRGIDPPEHDERRRSDKPRS